MKFLGADHVSPRAEATVSARKAAVQVYNPEGVDVAALREPVRYPRLEL